MSDKRGRLLSLDALRGFNMFFITGGEALLIALSLLVTGHEGSWLAIQMTHVDWIGLRLYDCIFPLFVFITGVTFPFSTEKRLARGDTRKDIALNVLRRTALLIFFGLLFSGVQRLDWAHFRVWSVIGRVGLVWGMAALLTLFFRLRTCIVIAFVTLVAWWLVLRFVPAPDAPVGVNPALQMAASFPAWFDTHFLTTVHRHEGGLATLAMVPTGLFGVWAGKFLMLEKQGLTETQKTVTMLMVAVASVVFGCLWALPSWGVPVIKSVWSSSYTLVTGGLSLALLATFHWIIDVRGWVRWSFFFRVIGINAIAAYLAWRFIPFGQISRDLLGALPRACDMPGWEDVCLRLGKIVILWFSLLFLYKKEIIIKA